MTFAISEETSPVRRLVWNFLRHLLEMLLAMVVGMALLGGLVSLLAEALGQSDRYAGGSWHALVMTVNMTAGMGVWMRYRRHHPRHIAEMAAAMIVPLAVLIAPFWAGLITRGTLMGGLHLLMVPAMVGAMLYRRDVYCYHHHRSQRQPSGPIPGELEGDR